MNNKLRVLLLLVVHVFLHSYVQAQEDKVSGIFSITIGLNRSELPVTRFRGEDVNGGVGFNLGVNYLHLAKSHYYRTGLHYSQTQLLISENLSRTQKFTNRTKFLTLPLMVGTEFNKTRKAFAPILEAGLRVQTTIGHSHENEEILSKEDMAKAILAYGFAIGFRLKRTSLRLAYFRDFNKLIKAISEKNEQIQLNLSFDLYPNEVY